ncbi:alpha-E domain-containing protein, partial [Achromobacter xylosoxidans]
RADNTARMLDVKFHERDGDGAPQQQQEGRGEGSPSGALQSEFYRWSALLSSVSGLEIYRKVYRDVIT